MELKVLGVAMSIFLLAACTSTSNPTESAAQKLNAQVDSTPCYFPNTKDLAPDWVCGEPVEEYPLTAVGKAEKRSASMSMIFLRNLASHDAKVNLVRQKQQKAEKEDKEEVKAAIKTKTLRYQEAPNGDVYVLIAEVE